jgi:hypothetical protein
MAQPVYDKAHEVVKNQLKIGKFIEDHWEQIEKRLMDAEERVREAGTKGMSREANVVFVAECLPFVAGIVHVGSSLEDFRNAKKWVMDNLEHADPVSVLSALTFVYIVENGEASSTGNQEKLERWQSIHRRVDSLLNARKPPTAA